MLEEVQQSQMVTINILWLMTITCLYSHICTYSLETCLQQAKVRAYMLMHYNDMVHVTAVVRPFDPVEAPLGVIIDLECYKRASNIILCTCSKWLPFHVLSETLLLLKQTRVLYRK